MPLTIAIVDDEVTQIEYLRQLVNDWAEERCIAVDIYSYTGADAFLFAYEEKTFGLLLLDIEMEGINGMELAKKLRAEGDNIPIIFITGFADYMSEGYDVEALHYLCKPLEREKFIKVLDRYADRKMKAEDEIIVDTAKGSIHISVSEIMYAEAFGRTSRLYMRDGTQIDGNVGIGVLLEQLTAAHFIHCHRSYAVNLRYVRAVGRTEVTLDNGKKVPVSRRIYGEVSKAFVEYYRGKTGGLEG